LDLLAYRQLSALQESSALPYRSRSSVLRYPYPSLRSSGEHAHCYCFIAFERNFRFVQALLLPVALAAILGRNVRGIFYLGYGICIASGLMSPALESHFRGSFTPIWVLTQPLSYVVSLATYLFRLLSFEKPVVADMVPALSWASDVNCEQSLRDPG